MSARVPTACPVCAGPTTVFGQAAGFSDMFAADCPRCGRYLISGALLATILTELSETERRILAGQLRNIEQRSRKEDRPPKITTDSVKALIAAANIPRNPAELLDRVLLLIAEALRDKPLSGEVRISLDEHLSLFLPSEVDLRGLLGALVDRGYLKFGNSEVNAWRGYMTMAGWERVRDIEHTVPRGWMAFVAMAFAGERAGAWTDGIKPALVETGYDPIRVDQVQHLGKIDDRIIAELRQCSLVIADFTGHRQNVYFECGYAMGRGVPVVFTCHEDDLKDAHFDTRQYNHIKWSSPENLRSQLVDRIRATMPARAGGIAI